VPKSKIPPDRHAQALPAGKRRLFFLIMLSFPILLIVLTEIGLRLFNYGPNLDLFTTERLNGVLYHNMNPAVKSRYFSLVQFSPSTSPDYFLVPKPAGTYRIFCLGGSTTVGYPYWYNGSFSSFLRDRLHRTFPGKKIEIINVGMTATNSFTVTDFARDLVDYQPDLFIVYDGHNEFYGALGAASNESAGSMRWVTNAYLRLVHFKTFLLLRSGYDHLMSAFAHAPQTSGGSGTMMEQLARGQYVPYGSSTYRNGLNAFRGNLADLKQICIEHDIPVLLSTQVSNLRDQYPFISGDQEYLTAEQRTAFAQYAERAKAFTSRKAHDSAAVMLQKALAIDSLMAETHFALACCLDSMGRRSDARTEYLKARDYDQLRFRTSTDFNNGIMQTANGSSVVAIDMERVFMNQSPDSLIGNTLIFEHLHPRSRGYFLIAKAYAGAMRTHGLLASAQEWAAADTVSDTVLWNERSVTELDERTAERRTAVLMSGWPFKDQFPIVDAVQESDTLGQIMENVTRARWNWLRGHEAAANYYIDRNQPALAEREYKTILNQIPTDTKTYLQLAHLYLQEKRMEEMRATLLASLKQEETILAYRALGDYAMQRKSAQEAITYYEKIIRFPQSPGEQVENGYLLALACYHAGQIDRSRAEALRVLKIKPDFQPAAELLVQLKDNSKAH
jgi:tetratricopeptide (TPR) repeat protein